MVQFLITYKNLILQISLSLTLTLLLTFLKIPVFFLRGLHTYIHPDNVQSGVRAAIRRPDGPDSASGQPSKSNPELRKRSKSKSNPEFDENNAQIFRLKLDEAHLQTRLYFNEYSNAFTFSFVAISCLLLQLLYLNNESDDKNSGFLVNGVFVPVLLGFAGVSKLLVLLGKVAYEKSASRRSEKQLSVILGAVGLVLGNAICFTFSPKFFDFNFESIDGFGKMFIAVLMGCFSGFLFIPAVKSARCFWLGTDQIRSDLVMLSCDWFGRAVLYVNHMMIVFTVLLWINPLAGMFVNKNIDRKSGSADMLFGNIGFSPSDFAKFRVWCLLATSLVQIVALRPNIQMYLNEALLSWYQRLHASRVPDLDFSRAKVFLHNHYLCLVVLQFLGPPVLLLLFLGLSQIDGVSPENYPYICSLAPCSAFVKEVALFMAWWILFVWTIYSSATIFLYRRCILYMT
ncbi:uncharacterized protein [Pyrus communis]|uniref:uncharacterized protein n=1 Tax=Pyrus communis TaxID=23211 RepID=UPI0035C0C3DF